MQKKGFIIPPQLHIFDGSLQKMCKSVYITPLYEQRLQKLRMGQAQVAIFK